MTRTKMMRKLKNQSIAETVHEAAQTVEYDFLEKPIYPEVVFNCLVDFDANVANTCVSIPIKEVVGIRERDFFSQGDNWKKAALGLHCKDWGMTWKFKKDIYRYFTTVFRNKNTGHEMPTCREDVRFAITGGAIKGSNGQHRIAAGMVLKAMYEGEDAEFIDVYTNYQPLEPSSEPILKNCLDTGSTLLLYNDKNNDKHSFLVVIKPNCSWEIFERDYKMPFQSVSQGTSPSIMHTQMMLRSKKPFLSFTELPKDLIERLLDKSWAKHF
ncbi:hypothetical protein AB6D85_21865 [Vibrio splendidus]